MIGERLFSVFDRENSGYIKKEDFIDILMSIFMRDFNDQSKIIFEMYAKDVYALGTTLTMMD
jgi:Ca2+-binding EF-hand superfamily protein